MKRRVAVSIASTFLLAGRLPAQTQIDMNQLRNLDLSRAGTVLFRSAVALPSTCSAGEALIMTNGLSGRNLYLCVSPNTWVLQGDTLGYAALNSAANLSDLASPPAARTNLGLGGAAVKNVQGTGGSLAAFAGGITIPNDCVKFDASGNVADAGVPCGSGGAAAASPNYSQSFTAQTSVVLSHNANSTAVLIQCFDGSNSLLLPNSVTLTSPVSATVSFAAPQTGTCVVNSSGGGQGGGAGSFSQITWVASIVQGGTGQSARGPAFDALAPTAAKGDSIVFDGSTNTRVAVGADGNCWVADSTQPAGVRWGACASTGAGLASIGNTVSIDATAVPTFLTGGGSISFASIDNGACASGTFSLNGAMTGDTIAAGWPVTLEAGLVGMLRVSAPGTIEVRLCNFSGAALTPAPGQAFAATIVRSF